MGFFVGWENNRFLGGLPSTIKKSNFGISIMFLTESNKVASDKQNSENYLCMRLCLLYASVQTTKMNNKNLRVLPGNLN